MRLRLRAAFRRGRRPGAGAPGARQHAGQWCALAQIRCDSARGAFRRRDAAAGPPALADDRWMRTQGWTGPKFVDDNPVEAPGARTGADRPLKTPSTWHARRLAEELSAAGSVRRTGKLLAGTGGDGADRPAPHGLQPARQRRGVVAALAMPGFRDYAVAVVRAVDAEATNWAVLRDVMKLNPLPATSASSARTKPRRTASTRCSTCRARYVAGRCAGRRQPPARTAA